MSHPRDDDLADALAARVAAACEAGTPLAIHGSGSKAFLGAAVAGAALDVSGHCGIVDYQPSELVLTARAGTPLAEVEAALAERGQCLAFEPPHFGESATLGGAIAAGLSGPARPFAGAARDFLLGVKVINGRGQILRFGGQVMKNVAGYDAARLMAGAFGTLGVLLEVSLKVLPRPAAQATLAREASRADALAAMIDFARQPLPVTGAWWADGQLCLRVAGGEQAVADARRRIGGEPIKADGLWRDIRDHRHAFFTEAARLWRLSLPPAAPALASPGEIALDWGGAQRWLRSDDPAAADEAAVREAATRAGGHATLFRGTGAAAFQPLPPALLALHQRLKQAFDPAGILNPGRLYPDL